MTQPLQRQFHKVALMLMLQQQQQHLLWLVSQSRELRGLHQLL
jgi:hypothetical protein